MKKLSGIRVTIIQILFLGIALFSWIEVNEMGSRVSEIGETGGSHSHFADGAAAAITSGFNGGALAMGLITVVCITCVTWLEVRKTN